jgi:hypothetical protein
MKIHSVLDRLAQRDARDVYARPLSARDAPPTSILGMTETIPWWLADAAPAPQPRRPL